MLRNVKFEHDVLTLHALLSTLVDGASYNFVFLPWVHNKDKNVGFAFVNFVDSERAEEALAALRGSHWPDSEGKEIEVRPAVVQGFEANMSNLSNRLRAGSSRRTLLLLHNGEQVCEDKALSLYSSPAFAEKFVLHPRQAEETEGASKASRSETLQDLIRCFGLPSPAPKGPSGAAPSHRLSAEDLSERGDTYLKIEAHNAARQMMLASDTTAGSGSGSGQNEANSSTPSPPSTTSRSSSSHSGSKNAAESDSLLMQATPTRPSPARQVPASPTPFEVHRPATGHQPVPARRAAVTDGHGWATPRRTPQVTSMMMMTAPSRTASDHMVTTQDLTFHAASSGRVPSRSLFDFVARYRSPNSVFIGPPMSLRATHPGDSL